MKSSSEACIIEFNDLNWIQPSNNYLLKKKSFLITTKSMDNLNSTRIRMYFTRAIQTNKQCSIFDSNQSDWNPNYCQTIKGYNYIECVCFHQSIYGLVTLIDPFYYGFNHVWFYISVVFVLIALLSAILTYFLCLNVYLFNSICFIQFLISISLTQLFYLLTVAISSCVISDEPDENNSACTVLSIFFHYFILSQFSWSFMCSFVYYTHFVKQKEFSFYFKSSILIIGWSIPTLIILIFYLITGLVYEYGLNLSASYVYTDLFDNNELCFIKNIWAFLLGLILPCITLIFFSLMQLKYLFENLTNFKSYNEMLMDLILCSIVILVNICAAIQIRFGYLWLFILFCVFDICLGIFVLINYTFKRHLLKRNQLNKLELLKKSQKNKNKTEEENSSQLSTSDSNKLAEIFKTSSSIETINSSLIAVNDESNDFEQLLDHHNYSLIINNNKQQLDQQDKEELETEIKEEFREDDFKIQ